MLNINPIVIDETDLLQLQDILKEHSDKTPCLLITSCSSTFDVIKNFLHSGLDLVNASSVLAQKQQAGRGQCDNSWYSPRGGLYASALLQKNTFSVEMTQIASLILGAATIEVLRDLGEEVFLKWPNDIVKKSQRGWCKAGGMLLQNETDWFFWGLGLNLQNFHLPNLTLALEPIGLSIKLSPSELWFKLWPAVWFLLEKWQAFSCSEIFIKRHIEPLLAFKNEKVVFMKDGECHSAVFRGLSAQGAALLDCQDRQITLYSGSLRPYRSILRLRE